jgi:hypothetical protein
MWASLSETRMEVADTSPEKTDVRRLSDSRYHPRLGETRPRVVIAPYWPTEASAKMSRFLSSINNCGLLT